MLETNGKARSLGELERDAVRNREALANSIDALQKRVSPSAIKHDVQNYVQTKKNGILEGLEQRAKENPLQAIAIAAGVAYPLLSLVRRIPVPILLIGAGVALSGRGNNHSDPASAGGPGLLDSARDRLGEFTEATIDRASEVAELVHEKANRGMDAARGAAGRVSRLGSEASEQAVNLAARVGETLTETAGTAQRMSGEAFTRAGESLSPERIRRSASEANDWIQDSVSRNPLLVGAIGIGIGAIIAAALPKTPQEESILGSAAEQVKRRARDAAAAGVHTATGVATDIYREAMAEAKNQGLSADGLKDAVAEVSTEARAAMAAAINGPVEARDVDAPSYQTTGVEKGMTT